MTKKVRDQIIKKVAPSLVKCEQCGKWWDSKTIEENITITHCDGCLKIYIKLVGWKLPKNMSEKFQALHGIDIEKEIDSIIRKRIEEKYKND